MCRPAGSLRADLNKCLSTKRSARKPRGKTERREKFSDVITISQRPAVVDDRAVPGHWEGDLILGSRGTSSIGTLVERSTRFTILLHLPGDHTADSVATAMIEAMNELPAHLRRTITWDRGSEMASWHDISLQLRPRSTSAIPIHPGSVAATRTPTDCCGSGSKRAPTSAATPKPTSNESKTNSTAGHDPPWISTPQPNG